MIIRLDGTLDQVESISKLIYFNALKRESDPFLSLSALPTAKIFFFLSVLRVSRFSAATGVFYQISTKISTISGSVLLISVDLPETNEKQGEK